jgi:hypothetical protein
MPDVGNTPQSVEEMHMQVCESRLLVALRVVKTDAAPIRAGYRIAADNWRYSVKLTGGQFVKQASKREHPAIWKCREMLCA